MNNISIFDIAKEFQAHPTEELAWKILETFYDFFEPSGVEEEIWFLVSTALKVDSEHLEDSDRRNILFVWENLKSMNQAVAFLSQRNSETVTPKKKKNVRHIHL